MFKIVISVILLAWLTPSIAQQKESPVEISVYGFVAVDVGHNTRGGRTIRNERIYLFPWPDVDRAGNPLSTKGNFEIDAAHSRFGINVKGPSVGGLSVSGLIEADFLGDARASDSNFRLRHAFLRIGHGNFILLAGQTWHPFFITENFPQLVNSSAGVPIHPLIRNPQLRLSWKPNANMELIAALIEQNNFRTAGYTRGTEQAIMPEVLLQLKLGGTGPLWGALSAGYKTLAIPETITRQHVTVSGFHSQASIRYTSEGLTARAGAIYGQNLSEMAITGGTGRVIGSPDENPEFALLATATAWVDINRRSNSWDPGIFAGYMQALGTSREVVVIDALSFHPDVNNVVKIAPRIRHHLNSNTWIGLEYMLTSAAWGRSFNVNGVPENLTNHVNHRPLGSFRYNF